MNADFFSLSFFYSGTENEARRTSAAGSSAAAVAPAARTDRGGADGLGWLGAALFKGCPRAVSRSGTARSRFVFFNYSARKKNKKKYKTDFKNSEINFHGLLKSSRTR